MYRIADNNGVIQLEYSDGALSACILTGCGNTLFSLRSSRQEYLHFPGRKEDYPSHNSLAGNPLMHPWANRLEGEHFWWDGHRYSIPAELIPMRDGNYLPLHGLLYKSPYWRTTRKEATGGFAVHEAHLDFAAISDYMSVFPFAHELTMRHWLEKNTLTISLEIHNSGEHLMPVCCGFHPYFSFAGYSRETVKLSLPVTERWVTNDLLLPTGEKEGIQGFEPGQPFNLGSKHFDDGFTGILSGQPFVISTPAHRVAITLGDNFPTAVVYAPNIPGKSYVCVEPMAAPTNALQLHHYGLLDVQTIEPGKKWTGWFSISVEEF